MTAPKGILRCVSVHSVKGGVGKSTVATLNALDLARRAPDARVYLIDMDLTGTSLADVLPLEAPRWADDSAMPDPPTAPTAFRSRAESVEYIERRDAEGGRGVPFLNDYLLYATPDWYEEADMPVEAVCWRYLGGPDNLRVVPSSALPSDLEATLPVIFDEQHSAYLEGRLERFLAAVCRVDERDVFVVFDVPPTIPGLSRAVLSLELRLGGSTMLPLAEGGDLPEALFERSIRARALMLTTLDLQDLRAMGRWMARVLPDEEWLFRVVLNRVPQGTDPVRLHSDVKDRLGSVDVVSALMENAEPIEEDPSMSIFGEESCPSLPFPGIKALLDMIEGP